MFKDLFTKLPQRCVVLLEDIDAVGTARSSGSDDTINNSSRAKEPVSMSGLLNTLDGVASQEGRVLIMTTNHVEKLDEALIRPGRIDGKAEFQLADASMIVELFAFILKPVVASDTGRESKADLAVDRLATEFAKKVPELEFSPAQVMSFLLQHRQSPTVAVEHAESWVSTMLHEKKDKLNRAIGDMYPANMFSQSTSMGRHFICGWAIKL